MHVLPQPPKTPKKPEITAYHGDHRVDEYSWLRKVQNPRVLAHIKAENDYADAVMKPTMRLQKDLYKEIRSRMKENDMSVPVKEGPYEYYSRTQKGKQYAIHCRKRITGGKEQVVLDENKLAAGEKFFNLGLYETSPDHRLLAYAIDTSGNEQFTLRIKDLRTGKLLAEKIESISDFEWAENGEHFFYTVEEHPHPPRKIFLHRLGEDTREDLLVYEEKDPQWYVGLDKSRSRKYIFFVAANFDSTEVRALPAHHPFSPVHLLAHRKKDVKYYVDHHDGYFYIMTNERAINFKIMRTNTETPARKYWREWMPHNIARAISGLLIFENFFAVTVREKGSEEIYIHEPGSTRGRKIQLPENEHAVSLNDDLEYFSKYIRISYQSFLTPRTVYDYYVDEDRLKTRKKQEVPGWSKTGYVSTRVWVKSGDVRVPVILVHAKKLQRDGSAPMLLEAYGSYGISQDPYFSISKLSLLKRGWVVALAHPRGGGEMGWHWHKQAKLLNKHRTYEDMIAVAGYLARQKYTSADRLALMGGSAGGMLVGAVMNMRPELFGAGIALVPAADIITSMYDESLGGTRLHYDEVGDPRIQKFYEYFKKYSPYEGVRTQAYPALLVRVNLNDIRTPFWEGAKWVARLRAKMTNNAPILLKTELVAGHFGKSGRYEWIKDRAFDFAFLLAQLPTKMKQ